MIEIYEKNGLFYAYSLDGERIVNIYIEGTVESFMTDSIDDVKGSC